MNILPTLNMSRRSSLWIVIATVSVILLMLPAVALISSSSSTTTSFGPSTLPSKTLVSAAPAGSKGPDDITMLAVPGLDSGKLLIWTAYQNGINPDGTPGTSGGPIRSTVAAYDAATGKLVRKIPVTGKVDGLTADPKTNRLIATVNEDNNSAINVIYPALGAVATYNYTTNPAFMGVGGTDSIAIRNGVLYVIHSNPANTGQATEYRVTLDQSTLSARLTPVFYDNSTAINVLSHSKVALALTDPDTNYFMPSSSPRFAGDLATISQADGQIIFDNLTSKGVHLSVLNMTDNKAGNIPPLDDIAVATSGTGTLYVVDSGNNTILALNTKGWAAGTVFVSEPKDNGNPLVGTLNLHTGVITPLANVFVSPKGILFVPS
jgi:hypothetical protein